MQADRTFELLVELHAGLARLGPGDDASTRRALACCTPRPTTPAILDLGCGTGAQSLCLAGASGGRVTAVDLVPAFIATLVGRARAAGLARAIAPCVADMAGLPFADASFDLVWSEGAAYQLGFDTALARWGRLLRDGGWLVLSELTWFGAARPETAATFWQAHYPPMREDAENLAAAEALGWRVAGHFPLPQAAWRAYHAPVCARLPELLAGHPDDPEAATLAAETRREVELMARHGRDCGYAFYVLQRA